MEGLYQESSWLRVLWWFLVLVAVEVTFMVALHFSAAVPEPVGDFVPSDGSQVYVTDVA